MSSIMTSSYRRSRDHFEPSDNDPQEQRRLRGVLEQIDYTAFVSNREVIPQVMGLGASHTEPAAFQRLAVAAATARASASSPSGSRLALGSSSTIRRRSP